jgi:hypothetical protein
MAHYRFSLFLLTCIACFAFVPSRDQDDRDRLLTRLYNQNPTSISMTSSEGGSFSDDQRMLLGIAPVIAQAPAPKTQKSTPNQAKPTSDTKPPKPKPSNARIPISINSIFQFIKRQKILLILSLAAVLVTGASVFVLLKLLENGEENHLKLNRASAPQPTPPNHPTSNQNHKKNSNFPPNSERPSSSIFDSADREAYSVIPSNPETLSPEDYNNGYTENDLSRLGKSHSTESLINNIPDIFVEETSEQYQIPIIERLIEDLAHPNPTQRHKAIWELGDRGDSRAVKPLVNLLLDSDSNQHSLILSSLSEIGIKTIKPMNRAWLISLQNENPEVRKNAIRDLTRIYELVNQITNLLQRAKDDPDPEVQQTARWALTQLNRDSAPVNRD